MLLLCSNFPLLIDNFFAGHHCSIRQLNLGIAFRFLVLLLLKKNIKLGGNEKLIYHFRFVKFLTFFFSLCDSAMNAAVAAARAAAASAASDSL